MTTTITKSIGATGRDYSTIALWIAAIPVNLVTVDEKWVGECYNDAEFDTGAGVGINGHTTDATRNITLTAAAGHSFADNANVRTNALAYSVANGVGIKDNGSGDFILYANSAFTTVSRLQLSRTGRAGYKQNLTISCGPTAANILVKDCIFKNFFSYSGNAIALISGQKAVNCLFYSQSTERGLDLFEYGSAINCTVIASNGGQYRGIASSYALGTVTNCAIFGFTNPTYNLYTAGASYNATDGSTLPGSNNQVSLTFANCFVSTTNDFRLKAGSPLIGVGYTDATNAPNDITGIARGATTAGDIGAWEWYALPAPGIRSTVSARRTYTKQPTKSVSVDRSNPLSRGILDSMSGNSVVSLVTGRPLSISGTFTDIYRRPVAGGGLVWGTGNETDGRLRGVSTIGKLAAGGTLLWKGRHPGTTNSRYLLRGGGYYGSVCLFLNGADQTAIDVMTSDGAGPTFFSFTGLRTIGERSVLVVTWTPTGFVLYKNGVQVGSGSATIVAENYGHYFGIGSDGHWAYGGPSEVEIAHLFEGQKSATEVALLSENPYRILLAERQSSFYAPSAATPLAVKTIWTSRTRQRQPRGVVRLNPNLAIAAAYPVGGRVALVGAPEPSATPTGSGVNIAGGIGGLGAGSTSSSTNTYRLHSVANQANTVWERPSTQVSVLAFLVRYGNAAGLAQIFGNGSATTSPYSGWALLDTGSVGTLVFDAAPGGSYTSVSAGTIPDNTPVVCIGTYDGTTMRSFINGVQVGSTSASGTLNYPGAADRYPALGNSGDFTGAPRSFIGRVFLGVLHNRAWTADEVSALSLNPWLALEPARTPVFYSLPSAPALISRSFVMRRSGLSRIWR